MLTPDIGIGRAATQGRGSQASGQASSSTQVYTSASASIINESRERKPDRIRRLRR